MSPNQRLVDPVRPPPRLAIRPPPSCAPPTPTGLAVMVAPTSDLALTPAPFPWPAGTVGVALTTCFVVLCAIWAALRKPDAEKRGGCGEAPIRRARRLMGWEGGYFLRSEIKKERDT